MTVLPNPTSGFVKRIGVGIVLIGDWLTVGGMAPIGASQGDLSESGGWVPNPLTAGEHTGQAWWEVDFTRGEDDFTVPLIVSGNTMLAKLSPSGSEDGIDDDVVVPAPTGMFYVPRAEFPKTGIGYNGTEWTWPVVEGTATPKNTLFYPRAVIWHDAIPRPYGGGGKAITTVHIRPMIYAAGPAGKKLFARGDPIEKGFTTFRL